MDTSNDLSLTFGWEAINQSPAGLSSEERRRHCYVIGQTGSGKTTLLKALAIQDIHNNRGLTMIDPHGDAARELVDSIPRERIADVVYFDTSDIEHPLGYNPLHNVPKRFQSLAVSSLMGCFRSQFAESWGPRMAYVLRHCLSALIGQPPHMHVTLLSVSRMLTERAYRHKVLRNIEDPVLKRYWEYEFDRIPEREIAMVISPILNKLGAYAQHAELRNIIGQAKSSFCLSEIMDKGRILIVNLSKPQIGDDGVSLLGSLLMSGLQQAAYRRDEIPSEYRIEHSVFVDEFQNFATPKVLASIFSESRKYALQMYAFHQYTDQLDEIVLGAVLGNVGNIAVFGVGGVDAERLSPSFPSMNPVELTESARGEFLFATRKGGEAQEPMRVRGLHEDWSCGSYDKTLNYTRATAGRNKTRADVEAAITNWYEGSALNAERQKQARGREKRLALKLLKT